jgi:hypothetical protein
VTQYSDVGYQHYNGILLTSRFNFNTLVDVNANYTLSKCEGLSPIGTERRPLCSTWARTTCTSRIRTTADRKEAGRGAVPGRPAASVQLDGGPALA